MYRCSILIYLFIYSYLVILRNSGTTPYNGADPFHLSINCLYRISFVKPRLAIMACCVLSSSSSFRFRCSIICCSKTVTFVLTSLRLSILAFTFWLNSNCAENVNNSNPRLANSCLTIASKRFSNNKEPWFAISVSVEYFRLSSFIKSTPLFLRTQNTMTDRFKKSLSFSAGHDINEN